jgi:hypothetical protein
MADATFDDFPMGAAPAVQTPTTPTERTPQDVTFDESPTEHGKWARLASFPTRTLPHLSAE